MRSSTLLLSSLSLILACSEYSLEEKLDPEFGEDEEEVEEETQIEVDTAEDTAEPIEEPVNENAPIANCSVAPNPVTPPFTPATWDGSGSTDPNGSGIASYKWELIEKPEGSATMFAFSSGAQIPNFYADLAGNYVGQLTVENYDGLTDTCQVTLQAIPSQNLWVEMFWQYPDEDMDLHLLAPNGVLETNSDCYYSNCTGGAWFSLDWGQVGITDDDPALDLDDIPGTGPENINIASPQTNGEYTVVVHDYTGSTNDVYGNNEVTVNIYLGGSLIWSDTKTISGEGTYTSFATINWGNQSVTGL